MLGAECLPPMRRPRQAKGHRIDYDDWHAHAHGVLPYDLLRPDPALGELLRAVPLPKWVFTNADTAHAERCLDLLGVRDCFQARPSSLCPAPMLGLPRLCLA